MTVRASSPQPRPRPGILEIAPYVGGKAGGEGGNAVKLSANEGALGPSPKAMEAYAALARDLHRYPDGGSEKLRRAIASRFNLPFERVTCGAGSDELISLLCQAYAGPGDEVLHSAHGFLMYRLSALGVGAVPVAAPERDLTADVDALLSRVTSRTRVVFLANPNNPTGTWLPETELRRLHAGLPADVLLVIDGAYAEYVDRPGYSAGEAMALELPNVAMTRTFSKMFGLAALRLGWMLSSEAVTDTVNRLRGPFNVSAAAQVAGVAALNDVDHQEAAKAHNDRWLPWLRAEVQRLGFKALPSAGNFFLIDFGTGERAAAAAAHLEGKGVIPRAMGGYGLAHTLRVTVGTEADCRAFVEALESLKA